MSKRCFEKVSLEQWNKDMSNEFYFDKRFSTEIYNQIQLPKRATANSAGYDFFSPISFELKPNEEIKLPSGIKVYMNQSETMLFFPRSSLGFKYYMRFANTIPVGDGDYADNINNEGHYFFKFRNEGDDAMRIKIGDAICQGIFFPFLIADNDNFEGETRVGGIGSTNQ